MEKVTIAFVESSLSSGGSHRTLFNLIRGLDKDKFRPVLCCLYGPGPLGERLQAEGYHLYHDLIHTKYDPRSVLKVAAVLQRERPCVLYMTNALLNVVVGRLAAFVARVPLCVTIIHSYGLPDHKVTRSGLANRMLLPHFDLVIAVAEMHKTYLISSQHIPARKISVVYNGVDLHQFARPVDARAVRHNLQIPDGTKVVGIIASLWPWKAHNVFLRAAATLLKELPDTYFVIAGDGPERNKLERMARNLGVTDHVRFLGRVDDVPALLQSLDLSVLTSVTEAFPLALLESMAAARPVVATSVGSVPELVVDGMTGFLVPPGAPDQLAQAMLRVLRNPELAQRLGEEGRRSVEQKFTVERMISRTESLLLELVNSREPSCRYCEEIVTG
jgi:glycosyltransferase involved in cell wall biosynthesis